MKLRIINVLLILLGSSLGAGCVSEQSGAVEPGVNLGRMKSFYVVCDKDSDVATAIQKELARRGCSPTSGPESATPASADCKVLFTDKWMWDITVYLLEVKLELVDPKTGSLFASGRSYRTSLVRKSPEYMVKEIFDRLFPSASPKE